MLLYRLGEKQLKNNLIRITFPSLCIHLLPPHLLQTLLCLLQLATQGPRLVSVSCGNAGKCLVAVFAICRCLVCMIIFSVVTLLPFFLHGLGVSCFRFNHS